MLAPLTTTLCWLCSPRWYHPLIECWHPLFSGILSLIVLLRREISTDLNSGLFGMHRSSLLLPSAPLCFCRHRWRWVGVRLLGEGCVRPSRVCRCFYFHPLRRLYLQMQIGPPGRLSYTPGDPILRLRYFFFIFLFGNLLVEANLRRATVSDGGTHS